jgi:hypothetical protein
MKALLVNDASLAGHHGSALVTEQIKLLSAEAGIETLSGWDWESVLKACQDEPPAIDLVIVNGEGSIHHNSKSARRIAAIALQLREKRVPAYLVNATIEACDPDILNGLGAFRARFVRDSLSCDVLEMAGISSKVVPDLVLSASLPASRPAISGPLTLTDSSEEGKTARLIGLAQRWPETNIVTLRCPPPWPARGSSLRKVAFELKRAAAKPASLTPWSLRYAGAFRTIDELMDALASSRGLVTARYHGLCLALLIRLPFIAIEGNTGKAGALLRDIGLNRRCVDLDELTTSQEPPELQVFDDRESKAIDVFLSHTRKAAREMFNWIADDASALLSSDGDRRRGRTRQEIAA